METSPLEKLVGHLADELRSLVPLIRNGDDDGVVAGSGTLLRVGGDPFLVTASHVAKDCDAGGGLRIPSVLENRHIPIGADGIVGVDDDKHDVAVLRITDAVAARLGADNRYFLSTAHIETVPPPNLSLGRCLVLGFPSARTKREGRRVEYGPQAFVCEPAGPESGEDLSSTYDPRYHFLLHLRPLATDLHSGAKEPTVDPRGMSGGSLWWLGAEDDIGTVEQRAQAVRWIGVQSAAFAARGPRSGFLKAVTLQSAARLMCRQWPDLGGPNNPDFAGVGSAGAMRFDITTNNLRTIDAHMRRSYGTGMWIVTYSRPASFRTFPKIGVGSGGMGVGSGGGSIAR